MFVRKVGGKVGKRVMCVGVLITRLAKLLFGGAAPRHSRQCVVNHRQYKNKAVAGQISLPTECREEEAAAAEEQEEQEEQEAPLSETGGFRTIQVQ